MLKGTDSEAKAKQVSAKTLDFIKLVSNLRKEKGEALKETAATTHVATSQQINVTYHDSCHLNWDLGVKEEPREVLKAQSHINFIEMNESDRCCGFGGSYCIKLPEISQELLKRKLKNIEESKAQIVAVDCPGCLMNIRGGLDKQGSNVKALHTAQLLDGKY